MDRYGCWERFSDFQEKFHLEIRGRAACGAAGRVSRSSNRFERALLSAGVKKAFNTCTICEVIYKLEEGIEQ